MLLPVVSRTPESHWNRGGGWDLGTCRRSPLRFMMSNFSGTLNPHQQTSHLSSENTLFLSTGRWFPHSSSQSSQMLDFQTNLPLFHWENQGRQAVDIWAASTPKNVASCPLRPHPSRESQRMRHPCAAWDQLIPLWPWFSSRGPYFIRRALSSAPVSSSQLILPIFSTDIDRSAIIKKHKIQLSLSFWAWSSYSHTRTSQNI